MKLPLPAHSDVPLAVGDRVQISEHYQDSEDNSFERVVVEVPEDSTRVLIRTIIPGLSIHPTERIEAQMLERVVTKAES